MLLLKYYQVLYWLCLNVTIFLKLYDHNDNLCGFQTRVGWGGGLIFGNFFTKKNFGKSIKVGRSTSYYKFQINLHQTRILERGGINTQKNIQLINMVGGLNEGQEGIKMYSFIMTIMTLPLL